MPYDWTRYPIVLGKERIIFKRRGGKIRYRLGKFIRHWNKVVRVHTVGGEVVLLHKSRNCQEFRGLYRKISPQCTKLNFARYLLG